MLQLLPIALLGCTATVDSPANDATGQAEEAVTVSGWYEWGSTTSKTADLGTATGYTCFLTSVRGSMWPFMTDIGLPPSPARAGVTIVNGRWQFREWSNGPMDVAVQCIAGNRTAMGTWKAGAAATVLAPAIPGRQCFLTEVTKNSYSGGWTVNGDNIRVWKDTNNWYIGGQQTESQSATGTAACIDSVQNFGSWLWIAGSGSATHDLAYNPGGVDCFLTGLGGHFDGNSYDDGVKIGYDAGILTYNETVVNGKSGWATCVK